MSVNYTVTITEAQNKALSTVVVDQQEWIEHVVNDRCRVVIEQIVAAEIERKLAIGETISGTKEELVLAADVETAAERQERFDSDIQSRMAQ